MSQVKKLQGGGTAVTSLPNVPSLTPPAQATPSTPTYKFKVDNNDFELDDNKLDTAFNNGFNQLVSSGYAKANDRDQWNQRYQTWKQQAKAGTYNIDLQGNELGGVTYSGGATPTAENLGLDKNGNAAKSNFLGRVFGGVDNHDKQMALLNTVLGKNIGDLATTKFQGDQAAADKAKLDATNKAATDRGDFLSKYGTFTNPATALYGRDGEGQEGAQWAGKQFWNQKHGQTNMLLGALGKFGSYINDEKFNDPEYQKQFKADNKVDINDVRAAFQKYGFANGTFPANTDATKLGTFLGEIGLHRAYEPFLDRKAYTQANPIAPGTPGTEGTPTIIGTTTMPKLTQKDGSLYVDPRTKLHYSDALGKQPFHGIVNGISYDKGLPANGIFGANDYGHSLVEDSPDTYENARFVVNGSSTSREAYEDYLKKKGTPEEIQAYQDKLNKLTDTKKQFLGTFANVEASGADRNDHIFHSEYKTDRVPEKAMDATHFFPDMDEKGRRVVRYVPKGAGKDPITGLPIVRTRVMFSNGSHLDGVERTDRISGRTILSDGKNQVDLGRMSQNSGIAPKPTLYIANYNGPNDSDGQGNAMSAYSEASKNNSVDSPFNFGQKHKDGGVIIDKTKLEYIQKIQKAQYGGALLKSGYRASDNQGKNTAANNSELFNGNVNLSAADKVQLGGLAADTAGLIASFTGVGSLGAAGLGAAGTTANLTANVMRHGWNLGDVGSAALGYGLDAVTAIPGLGILSDTGKVVKSLRSASKILGPAMAGLGLYEGAKSLSKIGDPSSMNLDDWKNIITGIQSVLTGKRVLDNVTGTTKVNTNTVRANGEDVPISPELVQKLASVKSPAQKITMIKQDIAPALGIDKPEDINLDTRTTRNFMKFKFWNPDKIENPIVKTTGEYKLKDINGAQNFYTRNAINNVASSNPKGGDRFAINSDGDLNNASRFGFFGNNVNKSFGGIKSNDLRTATDNRLQQAFKNPLVDNEANHLNFDNNDGSNNYFLRSNENQSAVRDSNAKGFLTFKRGGVIKAQFGYKFPYPTADDSALNIPNYFNVGTNGVAGTVNKTLTNPNALTLPNAFNLGGNGVASPISKTIANLPSTAAPLVAPATSSASSKVGTTVINPNSTSLGLSGLTKYLPKIDLNTASEFARALYIRNNNANVDINVRPALLSQDLEISPSVHGDLFTKNQYDQRANRLVQDVARSNQTSDGGLQVAKMLGAEQQAQQLRDQGQNASNQMLYQNQARSEQYQAKYADDRQKVANENISNLASADESMRQLRNMKQASMNQPIDDFWKTQNAKNEYQNQQTKEYGNQLQQMGEYATYNNYAAPLTYKMNDLWSKYSTATNDADRTNYMNQYNDLQNQASRLSTKFQYRTIALRAHKPIPGYDPNTYYTDAFKPNFVTNFNTPAVTLKSGGQIAIEENGKNARAAAKQESDSNKSFLSNYEKWLSDDANNTSKESIAALNNINAIIKGALS